MVNLLIYFIHIQSLYSVKNRPNIFSSAILSRDTENKINIDDYVVIENVSDEIDCTDVKSVQPDKINSPNVKIVPDEIDFTTMKSAQSNDVPNKIHIPNVKIVPDENDFTNVKSVLSKNVQDKIEFSNVETVQSENLREKNDGKTFDSPKETSLHYVQFNNEPNKQFNDDNYYNENSSVSSSSDSISFQKIALTPIEEYEVKSLNRYVN